MGLRPLCLVKAQIDRPAGGRVDRRGPALLGQALRGQGPAVGPPAVGVPEDELIALL